MDRDGYWVELADGVFARRHAELDLTTGLVVGGENALVVDTRGDRAQGAELAAAVRAVTSLPVRVVYTHAHFDHCFGTRAFLDIRAFDDAAFGTPRVYAHPGCAVALAATDEAQRAEWTAYYRERGDPVTADELATTPVVAPDTLVERATLDLGGRTAVLGHPGPGHTDHDLTVHVPDAQVLFAGDLVEQGAPPDFTDGYPLGWPAALGRLVDTGTRVVVPGHGDPVAEGFVATQRAELAVLAGLCREVLAGRVTSTDAVRRSPYPAGTTHVALARARTTSRQETHP